MSEHTTAHDRANRCLLDDILRDSVAQLFEASCEQGMEVGEAHACMDRAVVIGFYADELRGVLGVGASQEVLERFRPASDEASRDDWLGEQVNQLLGRVKTQLLRYGVVVGLALPTVLRGVRLELTGEGLHDHRFISPQGPVHVWLDVAIADDVVLRPTGHAPLNEGEALFF